MLNFMELVQKMRFLNKLHYKDMCTGRVDCHDDETSKLEKKEVVTAFHSFGNVRETK